MARAQKPKQAKQPDDTGCKTCVYYTGGVGRTDPMCNFLHYTGQPRGCPAGAGCTRRETRQDRIRTDRSPFGLPDTLAINHLGRAHWAKEKERAARHFEEMTRRPGKQKIAAGGGTPTTTKENLLQSDDTIISGKSQVRPIYEKEF